MLPLTVARLTDQHIGPLTWRWDDRGLRVGDDVIGLAVAVDDHSRGAATITGISRSVFVWYRA